MKHMYWRRVVVSTVRERAPEPYDRAVNSPSNAAALFRQFVGDDPREHFVAFYLDAKHRPVGVHTVAIGSSNSCAVSPRDVLAPALALPCVALIVAHNHPSGDPTPSQDDLRITSRLKDAAETLGLSLLDHVVVTHDSYVSLAERA